MGQKGPFLHDKQLKNIFSGPTSNNFTPMPYKRKAAYGDGDDIQCKSKQTKESCHNAIDNNSKPGCASKTYEQNHHVNEIDLTSVKSKIKKPTTQKSQEDKKRLQEKQELADKYLYYRG